VNFNSRNRRGRKKKSLLVLERVPGFVVVNHLMYILDPGTSQVHVYRRDGKFCFAIDLGRVIWTIDIGGPYQDEPEPCIDNVFVNEEEGYVYVTREGTVTVYGIQYGKVK